MYKFQALVITATISILLTACAPKSKSTVPPLAEASPAAVQPLPTAVKVAFVQPTPQHETRKPVVPERPAADVTEQSNPNWGDRFKDLYAHYESAFKTPAIGERVEVTMQNGQSRQGILEALTADSLVLNVGMGTMTLTPDSLADISRVQFFVQDFAKLNAMKQLQDERARWTEKQRLASRPTPTPRGHQSAVRDVAGNNPKADPPRNEPPNGRVWQVEQYLRKSVAVPHSLRFLDWGAVHPHGDGYTVRCKYTVESVENFGRNTEEMIFFMRSDGTVYNKAAFKGGQG
jgi:hypothetical protein